MVNLKEQNVCIRFGFKLGKNIMETCEVLKIAYGEQTVERPLVLSGFPSPRVVCLLPKLPEA
jgi:hypothetical protein